jgi:DNA-binding transcriptional ArsR family regulator/L-alanine-DL-glutamate epimerase-like enolase superfamily enzyme
MELALTPKHKRVPGAPLPVTRARPSIDADRAERVACYARALADPIRVQLVDVLAAHPGELCACELLPMFDVAQSTLSHHLKTLADAGILETRRQGLFRLLPGRAGSARGSGGVAAECRVAGGSLVNTSSAFGRTYAHLAELPLVIDGYALDGLSRRVSTGFRRFTTVFRLSVDGHEGLGEDVSYAAAEHRRLQRAGPVLPLAGRWTLAGFSQALDTIELFHDAPPADGASREYRRWAVESAALDLALRQAGVSLHHVLDRRPAPVRFVVSLHLGDEPCCAPLVARRACCTAVRFKLDATPAWDDGLLECLAASGTVAAVDFKGVYQGTLSETRTDPRLYRRVAEALPDVWLEDPDLRSAPARAAIAPHRARVTWDAPIHSAADIASVRCRARAVNIKPSRFGTLRALFDAYDYCALHGVAVYGGGQYELGPGRGQIQYLASLFHPDAPNDVAPAEYDEPAPSRATPCTPMTIAPDPSGFRATPARRQHRRGNQDVNSHDRHVGWIAAAGGRPPVLVRSPAKDPS